MINKTLKKQSKQVWIQKLVALPSGVLVIFGIYKLLPSSPITFIEPVMALLFIILGLFGLFTLLQRQALGIYATVIIWVLGAIITIATISVITTGGLTCKGLFAVQTSCSSVNHLAATIYLLNPYSQILWCILAGTGLVVTAIKSRRN